MERATGRVSSLKFSVYSKDPAELSEFVKTRDRENLFWGTTHERINGTFHDLPTFFSAFILC